MLEEVGHGGMAVVYRGRDQVLDREVAVKVLHPHLADREESRLRLRREALTVAKLRHENIVEIYDYSGPEADESYIVTEFIHGETLRDWLDGQYQPHPLISALIVHRLCLALDHAHKIGVVHRDIKPENVMIRRDGCLKLMDFGIAQILDAQKLTMTGQLLGSPAYMAPELICGKPVDKRTDLFACGVLLYQLATGNLPFAGRNPHEVLHKISDGQYPSASKVNPKVDDALSEIIDKSLAQEPSDRFSTARSLSNELEDYLSSFDLDVENVDLARYFRDPAVFIDELDRKVCETLLVKARDSSRSGNRAKALAMLGLILELDPDNQEARSLVEEVKVKGRRLRGLVFGAAGLAVGGLIIAGVMLARASETPELADSIPGGTDALPSGGSRVRIPSGSGDRGGPKPNPLESGDSSGEGAGDLDPDAGATNDEPTAGTGETGRSPIVRRPTPPNLRAGRDVVDCTVLVTDLAASPLRNGTYKVTGWGTEARVLEPHGDTSGGPTGKITIPLDADSPPVTLKLKGGPHEGSTMLTRDRCKSGSVRFAARPRAAQVRWNFVGAEVSARDVSVQCPTSSQACWAQPKRNNARGSEIITFRSPGDETEWDVTVTFVAPWGAKTTERIVLHSSEGVTEQTVRLDPQ